MEQYKMKVVLLPHTPFLRYDGKFDKETAIEYCAKLAGECYEPDGWSKLKNESPNKTARRVQLTLDLEHTTPYEHVSVGFEISNLPKILAMVLNNEKQYTTSEKSARYTEIDPSIDPNISSKEAELYSKWMEIFTSKIKNSEYKDVFNDSKIKKLAQENARYLVSVFASTKMIHTIPWYQLNRLAVFMKNYSEKENKNEFEEKLSASFVEFIGCLEELNLLDERAMSNKKHRTLSLFGSRKVEDSFNTTYSTNYKGSLAQLAQAQRTRPLEYEMMFLDNKEYFIPPILLDEPKLVDEWLKDMNQVESVIPQGELVSINECGSYSKFILKCKERLCSAAQQEIMAQTKDTLTKYNDALTKSNHDLATDIKKYTRGARCTFCDYTCTSDCKFAKGKMLDRTI